MYAIKDETMKVPLKVFSTEGSIEPQCIDQMKMVAKSPFLFKHVSLMPDGHLGIGASIGSVVPAAGVIFPSLVGVDIGCGMIAVRTSLHEIETDTLKEIMGIARKVIPVGFTHQEENQEWGGFDEAPDIAIIQQELNSSRKQLGTLGGGNHFIEIQRGDDGFIWLMIHSGSRNFGLKTAGVFHKAAQALCQKWQSDIPDPDLAFLPIDTREGQDYYKAMSFCLNFAQANRALMMRRLTNVLWDTTGAIVEDEINIHHNYAAFEHHYGKDVLVHRKGATKAAAGQRGIIPGSMGTSSYIVTGLGNRESFESCSHGAGRRMGRKEATRTLNLEDEQEKMAGIIHGLRTAQELDEAPGAYKDIDDVMRNQQDLVSVAVKLTPLAVIKG